MKEQLTRLVGILINFLEAVLFLIVVITISLILR